MTIDIERRRRGTGARPREARFGLPESEMGLAMDPYDAGLIEELHDASSFDAELRALEDDLAGKPAYVHGFAKRQVHSVWPPNLDEAMQQAIHHAIEAYQEETQRRVADFFEE